MMQWTMHWTVSSWMKTGLSLVAVSSWVGVSRRSVLQHSMGKNHRGLA